MSVNGLNTTEDSDMAEYDGQKVVTMMDVLQEQEDFEEDANAVLGASDDKNCTYSKGYVKRQAIYACVTCCPDAKADPTKRAGVCLACSLSCHENHELFELYTKRNFRCDCGNPKFNNHPCQFTPNKTDLNYENKYNQNFSGIYCTCHRPYPDPEVTEEEDMIQCIVCEDWLHADHLEATVPLNDQYAEMICKDCMEDNDFLHDYSDIVINVDDKEIIITDPDLDVLPIIKNTFSNDNGDIIEPKDHKTNDVVSNKDAETEGVEHSENKEKTTEADSSENKEITSEGESHSSENKEITSEAENHSSENKEIISDAENHSSENKEITLEGEKSEETVESTETKEDESIISTDSKDQNMEGKEDEDTEDKTKENLPDNEAADPQTLEKMEEDKLLEEDTDKLNPKTYTDVKVSDKTENVTNGNDKTSENKEVEETSEDKTESSEADNIADTDMTDSESKSEAAERSTTEIPDKDNKVHDEDSVVNSSDGKRKLSTEEETETVDAKKQKVDGKKCIRPRSVKRVYKGATFWPADLRHKLCTCSECISMYKDLAVLFLIDPEDTVTAYEALGKENAEGGPSSQYEKGLQALSSLDRVQQINALTEYNKMRDKLLDFLKSFKDRKEIVKEEDIKGFFAGMKPKREPDGVYFCR